MSQILKKIQDVDVNNSDNVKEALSTFVQNLSKHTEGDSHHWLRTLADTIHRFPKYCTTHRNSIETHLAHFLDTSNQHIVIEAAKCAHTLQQVRPSQEKASTPKTNWREQMTILCEATHALVGAIFTNAVDVYRDTGDQPSTSSTISSTPLSIALQNISEVTCEGKRQHYDVQQKHDLLCVRLNNVFVFIQAMLVETYPVAKPVRPQTILDTIVRALTVSNSNQNNLTRELDSIDVKIAALRTLDALVECLDSNLIPYSPLLFRIAMQTLRWTSENHSEEARQVRIQAYKTLTNWLQTLRNHRPTQGRRDAKGKGFEDELLETLLGDISDKARVVTLTMNSQPTKNLSKKAKRKLANSMLRESAIASYIPGESHQSDISECNDEDVTIAALESTESFLYVCGLFLKPTTHKIVQERLVRECHSIPSLGVARSLALLRALEACRKCVRSDLAPPSQYCLLIYSRYTSHQQREIAKFCSEALLDIRLHLHCAPPSLTFALQPHQHTSVAESEGKRVVSERNRAALEALLGTDKVPGSEQEEVITIPDEPASKKPRLDESVDRISVDDSVSVEISDDEEMDVKLIVEIDETNELTEDVEEIEPIIIEDKEPDHIYVEQVKDIYVEQVKETNIHEASTQMPANLSNDTTDGHDSPRSIEVDYDYPNTAKSKVTILEKLEDENLPSTNETDDVHITCGQLVKNSQELSQKKVEICLENKENERVNGTAGTVKINGDLDMKEVVDVAVTIQASDCATVDDMLADFVDEVIDDIEA